MHEVRGKKPRSYTSQQEDIASHTSEKSNKKNQGNLCIPLGGRFSVILLSTGLWTEMLINHIDNCSCQTSLPNHTSWLLTEKLCLRARKLQQNTNLSGAYSTIPKKQINTQAKLMLRRSIYLIGQKGLGHWERVQVPVSGDFHHTKQTHAQWSFSVQRTGGGRRREDRKSVV